MSPNPGDTIVVWFSCGAASAVAAKLTLDAYKNQCTVRVVNNPVVEEDPDNRRFLDDVAAWLGVDIESATNPKYPSASAVEVWDKRHYMSGIAGAPCTLELKKEARYEWERTNKADWHVLGFTADERNRHERFILTERDNVLPVLIQANVTKTQCFEIIANAGIALPRVYALGYPNANCIGCVKATSATYWNHVRKHHPEVFDARAEQSRRIGARLVRYQGKRVFLDTLPDTAKGRPLKSMTVECGIFCEEKRVLTTELSVDMPRHIGILAPKERNKMTNLGYTKLDAMVAVVLILVVSSFFGILISALGLALSSAEKQGASVGINGVVTTRCINGYEFVVGGDGSARQVMDEMGHGVRCGR